METRLGGAPAPALFGVRCKGELIVVKDSLQEMETGRSRRSTSEDGWSPLDYDGRFSALMRCDTCGDVVSVCGDSAVTEDEWWDEEGNPKRDFSDARYPRYFSKSPHIISVAKECPKEVKEEIVRSFALYWCDERACANALRSAIELLLTQQEIPTERSAKNGKQYRISLHDRIEEFRAQNEEVGKLLLTLKIVGNLGSHGDFSVDVRRSDLLDAYDIFDYVIERVYTKRAERIAKLATELEQRMAGARSNS
jgi:hypothetical protein